MWVFGGFHTKKTANPRALIHVSGYSLGTASAVYLTAHCTARSLVLAAPFTSFPEVGKTLLPGMGAIVEMALVGHEFKSIDWAPMINNPTLVLHGVEDETVPFTQGRQLSSAIKGSTFKEIPAAGHNGLIGKEAVIEYSKAFYQQQ